MRYAEAEYLDEPADLAWFVNDWAHWRARLPATYYCTHSLAPVAAITGARPVQGSGFVVPTAGGPEAQVAARLPGSQPAGLGADPGDRGLMENLRHGDTRTLRVVWSAAGDEDGPRAEEVFLPWPAEFPATDADPMGDEVAETLMRRDFATAVRDRVAPDQDVYFGVELSITGIQAMRSSLTGSVPVEVPDLRRPDVRRAHAADDWFPDLPEL